MCANHYVNKVACVEYLSQCCRTMHAPFLSMVSKQNWYINIAVYNIGYISLGLCMEPGLVMTVNLTKQKLYRNQHSYNYNKKRTRNKYFFLNTVYSFIRFLSSYNNDKSVCQVFQFSGRCLSVRRCCILPHFWIIVSGVFYSHEFFVPSVMMYFFVL